MAQGTITLTNGSTAVTGAGTDFTNIGSGDFITTTIGGVPYTIAVGAVGSATALTLAIPFDGPTAAGLAFENTGVNTMALATMGVTVQAQKALRFLISDAGNWRKIFSNDQQITITTPGGQQITGISWGYLSTLLQDVDPALIAQQAQQAQDGAQQAITANNAAQQAKTTAETAATNASNANNSAQQAKTGAETARAGAETAQTGAVNARNQAEQFANSINPALFMQKSSNLNDVANKAAARTNLSLDRVEQGVSYTSLFSQNKKHQLTTRDDGGWGCYYTDTAVPANSMWIALPIGSGGTGGKTVLDAVTNLGLGPTSDVAFRRVFGRGGGYSPAVLKEANQATADANGVNQISFCANPGASVTNYIVTIPGDSHQWVWNLDVPGQGARYFSLRTDNGIHTPEGRVAIQGSDVRIKDHFELPKVGAWDRVSQIGIMEFNYRGNPIPQRGYLAQQMGDIDPMYVFGGGTAVGDDGNEFEILNVNDKAVLADMITVIQQLQQKVEALEAELKK